MFCTAKLSMSRGFTKGVSGDVLYLQINDILEYNLPYVQSDFTYNLGPTILNSAKWQMQNVNTPDPAKGKCSRRVTAKTSVEIDLI